MSTSSGRSETGVFDDVSAQPGQVVQASGRRILHLRGVLLAVAGLMALPSYAAAQHCRIERVSISSTGAQANSDCFEPTLSHDGSIVAYTSSATNLVPGDTNGAWDIFVFDRTHRTTERATVSSSGTQANNASTGPKLSADGRFVAYTSGASNLDPTDINSGSDVFLRDRREGITELVSRRLDSNSSPFGCGEASISSDGRFVAFIGFDDNIVPGDVNGTSDVFLWNRQSRTMELISLWGSSLASDGFSRTPVVSADGRYVAFQCTATNWAPVLPYPFLFYVYRRDRLEALTEVVNIKADGSASSHPASSGALEMSADGRYVAYCSYAVDVMGHDPQLSYSKVYIRDMLARLSTTALVSATGGRADSTGSWPGLSDDGSKIVFQSPATNLVARDDDLAPAFNQDIFLRDLNAGVTVVVSVGYHGQSPNNGGVISPAISGDGRVVAFETNANNLAPGDTGLIYDIYVVECDNLPVMYYCESMPNSFGCFPSLEVDGEPSALDEEPFRIRAKNVLRDSQGFFLYSTAAASALPVIGGGWLCVSAPLQRMPTQRTLESSPYDPCNGSMEVDFDAWVRSGVDPNLSIGATVYVQAWSRDPGTVQDTSLTDAITFDIAP